MRIPTTFEIIVLAHLYAGITVGLVCLVIDIRRERRRDR